MWEVIGMWELIGLGVIIIIFGAGLNCIVGILDELTLIRHLLTRNNELTDKTNRNLNDIESLIRINQ